MAIHSSGGSWIADTANKRRRYQGARFNVGDANGNIKELGFGSSARILLPAAGIYEGLDLVGVPIGSGDGIRTKFLLPSSNVTPSSAEVYIDGLEDTDIVKEVSAGIPYVLNLKIMELNTFSKTIASRDGSTILHGYKHASNQMGFKAYSYSENTLVKKG